MKSNCFVNALRLKCAAGFVLVVFGISNLLQAQQEPRLTIPVLLQPKSGVYRVQLKANQLNGLINPADLQKLLAEKKGDFKFQKDTLSHRITEGPISGVVFGNRFKNESSQTYFMSGWDVRFLKLTALQSVKISLDTTNGKSLADSTFIAEIRANDLSAELFLPPNSFPQVDNPIRLTQESAPTGSPVEYQFQEQIFAPERKSKINVLFFSENGGKCFAVNSMDVVRKGGTSGLWGTVRLPMPEKSEKTLIGSIFIKAVVLVTHENGDYAIKIDRITETNSTAGIVLGIGIVTLFFVVIWLFKILPDSKKASAGSESSSKKPRWLERLFRFPLYFAVTPLRRYSISLAQILFWTVVVIFALVYVAFTRGEFLSITGQILILLGISATTAVASKATAIGRSIDIPEEYMKETKQNRIPRFRDLVSIDDEPNIFKFQIFAFTLLVGQQVIRDLLRTGNFPVLEDNLLTLMGISGGIYVANEMISENVWNKLETLIAKIEEKKSAKLKAATGTVNDIDEEIKKLKQEVVVRLKKIYDEPESK